MVIFVATFLATMLAVLGVLKVALALHVMDKPNERSSHTIPTPRGGGAGMVFAIIGGMGLLVGLDDVDHLFILTLCSAGLGIALLGLWDDLRDVSPVIRLGLQFVIAASTVYVLTNAFQWSGAALLSPIWFGLLSIPVVVWSINLFNFMDGIDGIAGVEAASIGLALIVISGMKDAAVWQDLGSLITAASLGFLVFNWQPARIFMGDVGSAFLGFLIATCAVRSVATGFTGLEFWAIIYAVFVTDTGMTLARRVMRGVNPMRAHREHGYQWAARRYRSHARVSTAVALINCCWLLPLALVAELVVDAWQAELLLVTMAYLPLVVIAWKLNAGKEEARTYKSLV